MEHYIVQYNQQHKQVIHINIIIICMVYFGTALNIISKNVIMDSMSLKI